MIHSTHFILCLYGTGHMVNDHSDNEKTCCGHYIGYFFWLAAREPLYALPQNGYHIPWPLVNHGILAWMRNNSMGISWGIDPTTHHIMSRNSTTELQRHQVRLCGYNKEKVTGVLSYLTHWHWLPSNDLKQTTQVGCGYNKEKVTWVLSYLTHWHALYMAADCPPMTWNRQLRVTSGHSFITHISV